MPDPSSEALIRFELRNSKPVDLLDLTNALNSFGEAYQDHVVRSGFEIERGNIRLFVREIRTGSIIADLASMAEQASLVLRHIDVAAGFVTHWDQLFRFFLALPISLMSPPTKREAEQAMAIMEPVAKDGGSQLFLNVAGDLHVHNHYDSQQANAIRNAARRYIGPQLPANQIQQDQLLTLFQVRGDVAAKVGDRGVIETISPDPVKLVFVSEDVKRIIVDQPSKPFQLIFLVDVEVRTVDGKPRLYRILAVRTPSSAHKPADRAIRSSIGSRLRERYKRSPPRAASPGNWRSLGSLCPYNPRLIWQISAASVSPPAFHDWLAFPLFGTWGSATAGPPFFIERPG
jgi:hypothetical protein